MALLWKIISCTFCYFHKWLIFRVVRHIGLTVCSPRVLSFLTITIDLKLHSPYRALQVIFWKKKKNHCILIRVRWLNYLLKSVLSSTALTMCSVKTVDQTTISLERREQLHTINSSKSKLQFIHMGPFTW